MNHQEFFSKLPDNRNFFFDLVDPSSRSEADILDMLEVLKRFSDSGRVTLGLNQNEANILSRLTGCSPEAATDPETALIECADLKRQLQIESVVIHSIRYAVGCDAETSASVTGPYCEQPQKSPGAGDRFNAGYALGEVLNCEMKDRLTLACASSGFFVRQARSAALEELSEFLKDWV